MDGMRVYQRRQIIIPWYGTEDICKWQIRFAHADKIKRHSDRGRRDAEGREIGKPVLYSEKHSLLQLSESVIYRKDSSGARVKMRGSNLVMESLKWIIFCWKVLSN